jgi:hypothetical protein
MRFSRNVPNEITSLDAAMTLLYHTVAHWPGAVRDQCTCGSGRTYGSCCFRLELAYTLIGLLPAVILFVFHEFEPLAGGGSRSR